VWQCVLVIWKHQDLILECFITLSVIDRCMVFWPTADSDECRKFKCLRFFINNCYCEMVSCHSNSVFVMGLSVIKVHLFTLQSMWLMDSLRYRPSIVVHSMFKLNCCIITNNIRLFSVVHIVHMFKVSLLFYYEHILHLSFSYVQ